MERTEAEKRAIIVEAMDPTKVAFYCGQHQYFGPSAKAPVKPALGCQRCWFVHYFHDIATAPPEQRAQRMDELDEIIHKMVEEVEAGTFDFTPFRHAQMEIESN